MNVVACPKVTITMGWVIGGGNVVTKDVAYNSFAPRVLAKIIRRKKVI